MKAVICLSLLVVVVIARPQQNDASYDGQHDAKVDEIGKPVHLTAKMQSPKGEMSLEDNQEYAKQDGVHKRIKRAILECRIVRHGGRRKRICRRIGITEVSEVERPHGGGGIAV